MLANTLLPSIVRYKMKTFIFKEERNFSKLDFYYHISLEDTKSKMLQLKLNSLQFLKRSDYIPSFIFVQ